MPEGPEVKTTVDSLHSMCAGKNIINIRPISGRYTRNPIAGLEETQFPLGIYTVCCKGKFIYFDLQHENYIFNTLGMTGTWSTYCDKHSRVEMIFDDGMSIFFTDVRNFGTLKIVKGREKLRKKLKSIGPDFLQDGFGPERFYSLLKKYPNKTISEFLMNQKIVSGIGNYLKAECLYDAKISPHRLCRHISTKESDKLFHACRSIIRRSYETGGATIKNYRKPDGKKGLYSQRFAVYNQKMAPCGNEVIKEKTLDKRTTHWVPSVQK